MKENYLFDTFPSHVRKDRTGNALVTFNELLMCSYFTRSNCSFFTSTLISLAYVEWLSNAPTYQSNHLPHQLPS